MWFPFHLCRYFVIFTIQTNQWGTLGPTSDISDDDRGSSNSCADNSLFGLFAKLQKHDSSDFVGPWLNGGTYRAGPHMIAIIFVTGTKYACNKRHDLDQICLQSWLKRGPSLQILAISFSRDQICLQCLKSSQSHVTMISGRISRKQHFDDCKHIWSQMKEIASIYGPFRIWDCKHIKSLYLSPFCGQDCKHISSLS